MTTGSFNVNPPQPGGFITTTDTFNNNINPQPRTMTTGSFNINPPQLGGFTSTKETFNVNPPSQPISLSVTGNIDPPPGGFTTTTDRYNTISINPVIPPPQISGQSTAIEIYNNNPPTTVDVNLPPQLTVERYDTTTGGSITTTINGPSQPVGYNAISERNVITSGTSGYALNPPSGGYTVTTTDAYSVRPASPLITTTTTTTKTEGFVVGNPYNRFTVPQTASYSSTTTTTSYGYSGYPTDSPMPPGSGNMPPIVTPFLTNTGPYGSNPIPPYMPPPQ